MPEYEMVTLAGAQVIKGPGASMNLAGACEELNRLALRVEELDLGFLSEEADNKRLRKTVGELAVHVPENDRVVIFERYYDRLRFFLDSKEARNA